MVKRHILLAGMLLGSCAGSAIVGIDFGARFIKVGVIQSGKGIDMVFNEATKRKSSAAIGFNSQEERVLGDDAQAQASKLPAKTFVYSKLLLGKSAQSSTVDNFKRQYFPYVFGADASTGAVVFKYDENTTFVAEEIAAFILTYAKKIADAHTGSTIRDCVITIPPYWTHIEREAIFNAAEIAGLNVISLLHDTTAWAFKYGFDKEADFVGNSKNVVFYDLGASSLKVGLASYQATLDKKNKTKGSMVMRAVAWDDSLGGLAFDAQIVEILADMFNDKRPGQDDVRGFPRAMAKLRKEAEKVKEVLSANTKMSIKIESLHDDTDFSTILERSVFEEKSANLFSKIEPTLQRLLDQANMTVDDIAAVEMVGGATRIPKVKQIAMDFFKKDHLGASLNGDDAAALGATLYAAKLSTSFRLRDFGLTDAYPYGISVKLDDKVELDSDEGDSKKKDKIIFKTASKFPAKKTITLTRSDDITVQLLYSNVAGMPAGVTSQIATFNISGVADVIARQKSDTKRLSAKPKLSVTFALDQSGLVSVAKSEVMLEMMETVEEWIEVATNASNVVRDAGTTGDFSSTDEMGSNTTNHEPVVESVMSYNETENGTPRFEGNGSNATMSLNKTKTARNSNLTYERVKVLKEKKRVHHIPVRVSANVHGETQPLNETQVQTCIQQNRNLLAAEELRRRNAEAKNVLESYILNTRDRLHTADGVDSIATEDELASVLSEFEKAEDWLYEEGIDLSAKEYKDKTENLEDIAGPIFFRLSELDARPKAVKMANDAINWTTTLLNSWVAERPEITERERNNTHALCANFSDWLVKVQGEQALLPLTSKPAFTSIEVSDRLTPIEKEMRKLIKKPKPKPSLKKNLSNITGANASNWTDASTNRSVNHSQTMGVPSNESEAHQPSSNEGGHTVKSLRDDVLEDDKEPVHDEL